MNIEPSVPAEISICVATYRRPQGLERLLESLQRTMAAAAVPVEILLIDNDAAASARPVFERWRPKLPALHYFQEPEANIAVARNRAVQEARAPWLACIDDDETAEPGWLAAYLEAAQQHPADGYFGPVLPRFEPGHEIWLQRSGFFDRPRFATGTRLGSSQTRTGNAFLRRTLFAGQRFDVAFGKTGGEDVELFARLLRTGAVFRWCDGAVVHESVPVQRQRLGWILARAFRGGMNFTRIETRHGGWHTRPRIALKALAGLLLFAALTLLGLLRGRTTAAAKMQRTAVLAGRLLGLFF